MHRAFGASEISFKTWTREALEVTSSLPGTRRVGLALVEGGGRRLHFTASDRDSSEGVPWCHIDAYDDVPLNTTVRSGEPVFGALHDLGLQYRDFVARQQDTGTVAFAAVPIVAAGQTLGAFVLYFDAPQVFDAGQRSHLLTLVHELGLALREVQSHQDRPDVVLSETDVPPGAVVAVHEVPSDLSAVGQARRFLRSTLSRWGIAEEATDTAVLCLSELVTNAVIHTRAGCGVRVLLDRGVLTTSVRDRGGTGDLATESPEDPLRVHGRGLQLVESLASRWGSVVDAGGATVWFVLDLPTSPTLHR